MSEHLTAFNSESSRYVGAALSALGLSPDEFFPPDARAAFAELERPAGLKWQGRPVWDTAVVTGLRAVAKARRQARAEAGPQHAAEFNEAWSAEFLDIPESLTGEKATKVGGVALQDLVAMSHRELDRAARNVQIANTILTTPDSALPSAAWSHQNVARAELQSNVADSLRWFTVQPPTLSEEIAPGQHPEFPNSFLVIAPTASGKTKMAGDWLAKQGVGANVPGQRSPRVLWVTDQQRLISDVLDPSKTLSRCLSDGTEFTAVWEGHKASEDAAGHLVGVTGASIKDAVLGARDKQITWDALMDKDGKKTTDEPLINPDDYDIVVFDEGDIMTSDLKKSIIPMFNDCKKLFLTATPFRNERQNLQRMMHSTRPVKLLEAVDQGIISPVRILTFPARDAEHAEIIAAFLACEMFLKEGKRAIIYCQPGQESAQARRVAEATRLRMIEELGEDYDALIEMVGSSRPDSQEVIDTFEASTRPGVLATRKMLRRGWDPARLDGCIFVGPQGDIIEFEQGIGRPLRIEPDNPDKTALIIQIPYSGGVGGIPYTAEMIFGFDTVMHGATLGRRLGRSAPTKKEARRDYRDYDADEELIAHIVELAKKLEVATFALGTPLVEAFISPDDPRYRLYVKPEGYDTSLGELVQRYPHITRTWFQNHLSRFTYGDSPGVPSAIIRNTMPVEVDEAARRYERYYNSEGVEAFLEAVEIPGPITGSLSATKVAERLCVPMSMLKDAVSDLEIDGSNRFDPSSKGRAGTRYDPPEIAAISEWIEQIPVAENGQVWMPELREKYGHFVKYYLEQQHITPKVYRHPSEALVKGRGHYVEAEDVEAMDVEYHRIKELMAAYRSLEQIGKNVGMVAVRLQRNLTPEEVSQIVSFEPLGKQLTRHLINDIADKVEARLRAGRTPDEVPRKLLASATGILGVTLDTAVSAFKLPLRMTENGRREGLFHIGALEQAVARYSSRPSFPAELLDIQFNRLPIKGQEPTEEQLAYAREVQEILQKLAALPVKERVETPAASNPTEASAELLAVVEAPVTPVVSVIPIAPETPVGEPPKQEVVVEREVIEAASAKEAGVQQETDQEVFFDAQDAAAEVNCLPHALTFLLSKAHRSWGGWPKVDARVYLKDSGYETNGVISQLSNSVVKRTEEYTSSDNNLKKAPPTGWFGHSSFAQHNNMTAEAFQTFLVQSYDTGVLSLNEKEWNLYTVDGKIEVFYSVSFINRVLKALGSTRRR